jgi:hypothetical protein
MSCVRGHLSPTLSGQEPVNHRGFDRLAKLLRQGRPNRGNHHQVAGGGPFEPRFQERAFFLLGEKGLAASAPVASWVRPRRPFPAEGGLKSRHGRAAHTQDGGRFFEGGPEQGRQKNRLTLSKGLD